MADFIKSEKTEKPLTIGIDAAWGMGKTTLMGMIRDKLAEPEEKTKREQSFRTVWFNAWKYDQEESLWAALALEILSQVRGQFNAWRRAKFWWKLNKERLDRGLLLRGAFRLLAYLFAIILLGFLVFGIATLWLGTTFLESLQRLWRYVTAVGVLGSMGAVYAAGKEAFNRLTGPFDLNISQYIREPNYKERVGFLAQFEEDFKRVVEVVTDGGKWPLVVFIDDLDRCAPPKPAEIIEAINILLDAKHCVFVIGMDSRTVAGSIEAKYKDLKDYLNDADGPSGLTLGQRFLEKIVQINFHIPRADRGVVESFAYANLYVLNGKILAKPTKQEVSEAEALIKAEQRVGRKSLDEAAQVVQAARPDIPQEVVAEAKREVRAKSFDDSEEVRQAVREAIPYLGFNPRKIKRFINLFRLQALIANRRKLIETGRIRLDLLAKWLIIVTRQPNMVEAMAADPGFFERLWQASELHEKLSRWHGSRDSDEIEDEQMKRTEDRLNSFRTDPRISRFIEASDLMNLLKDIDASGPDALFHYLHLTQSGEVWMKGIGGSWTKKV